MYPTSQLSCFIAIAYSVAYALLLPLLLALFNGTTRASTAMCTFLKQVIEMPLLRGELKTKVPPTSSMKNQQERWEGGRNKEERESDHTFVADILH